MVKKRCGHRPVTGIWRPFYHHLRSKYVTNKKMAAVIPPPLRQTVTIMLPMAPRWVTNESVDTTVTQVWRREGKIPCHPTTPSFGPWRNYGLGGGDFRSSLGMEPSLVGFAFLPHHPNFAEFRMTISGPVRLVLRPSWSGVNILHRI